MSEVHSAASTDRFQVLQTKGRALLSRAERHEVALFKWIRQSEYMVTKAERAVNDAQVALDVAKAERDGAKRELALFQKEHEEKPKGEKKK